MVLSEGSGQPRQAMNDTPDLEEQLVMLQEEHRKLDERIARLETQSFRDPIEMQRLKKEKLALKDHSGHLRDSSIPDIIA